MIAPQDINPNTSMDKYSRLNRRSGWPLDLQRCMSWQAIVLLFLWLTSAGHTQAKEPTTDTKTQKETLFTYRAPESDRDTRLLYEIDVLRLALQKTEKEYGPFRLEPTPRINVARCLQSIQQHRFTNFFCSLG